MNMGLFMEKPCKSCGGSGQTLSQKAVRAELERRAMDRVDTIVGSLGVSRSHAYALLNGGRDFTLGQVRVMFPGIGGEA